jgi:hypothetical protein
MSFPGFRAGGAAGAANLLRRALGVLWIADALVKLSLPFGGRPGEQSYEQIMAAEAGPPGLHHVLAWEANIFVAHPFLWWLPAAAELGIGAWLVTRPASRRALGISAAWAVVVWGAGEGMAGLASGVSSVLSDYPGAALLYALAAAVLFPSRQPRQDAAAAAEAGIAGAYTRIGWLFLWIGAAFFTALPQTGQNGLQFMLVTEEAGGAGPLRSMDAGVLRWLTVGNTNLLGFAAAGLCLAVGFTVFLGAWPRVFLSLSMTLALAAWVVFQNFGGIFTGTSTDVGTGPILILLALALWPAPDSRRQETGPRQAAAAVSGLPAGTGGREAATGPAEQGYGGSP